MNSKERPNSSTKNPQKKRLEQLKHRKELAAAAAEKQLKQEKLANSKSKKTQSREPIAKKDEDETSVHMYSMETVDYEYSVEEDHEDDEYKSTKNETIKKFLIDRKQLEKALRLAAENEKKLKSMLDESGKWFDRYEKMIDDLDEQLTTYNTNRKIVLDNIINGIQPMYERWQAARKEMAAVKFTTHRVIPSPTIFGNLAHYGISILRQILFYMAYCRDLVSAGDQQRSGSPKSDSTRTLNSLNLSAENK